MLAVTTRTVRDVMSIEVVSVVPEMTMRELLHTFLDAKVCSAPVLDPQGKLVGVVAEEDVMRLALAGGGDLDRVRVRDVMAAPGAAVLPGQPLASLLRVFLQDGVRRVLVVENGTLLGVVSPVDALRALWLA